MLNKKLTIFDVARLARVSTTTVSRVLNHKNIKRSTKDRVLQVIEKYQYQPDPYAQYLGRRSYVASSKTGSASGKIDPISQKSTKKFDKQ